MIKQRVEERRTATQAAHDTETRSLPNDLRKIQLRAPLRQAPTGPILIIDDVMDDANLARRAAMKILPESVVTICVSAQNAVACLESGVRPTVVLLDLKMPEMDGFAFLEWAEIHEELSRIPVVVVSAFQELENLRSAYALHARAFLVKPITPESLRSVLLSLNFAV